MSNFNVTIIHDMQVLELMSDNREGHGNFSLFALKF